MLTVIGGTYLESCEVPDWYQLYGSGLRGAAALSDFDSEITLISCIGVDRIDDARAICASFGVIDNYTVSPKTIEFQYYHPLAKPLVNLAKDEPQFTLPNASADKILYYGFAEATCSITGDYVVYDPQNWVPFSETGSRANHLAIVLNLKEALLLTGLQADAEIAKVGSLLRKNENAEVVVIKNGAHGAVLFDVSGNYDIPLFETSSVFSVGSGDIFSAMFAYEWAVKKVKPIEAATRASMYTATYCCTRVLPLPHEPIAGNARTKDEMKRLVYLAGPFFSLAQRWQIDEARNKLLDFGNRVFSPLHDVGFGSGREIVEADIDGIKQADVMLAVLNGNDPGTIFEIGYAVAIGKRVVILAENYHDLNLTMFNSSKCEITDDFTTAIYKSSW